jgi:hypothetical protein
MTQEVKFSHRSEHTGEGNSLECGQKALIHRRCLFPYEKNFSENAKMSGRLLKVNFWRPYINYPPPYFYLCLSVFDSCLSLLILH